MTGSRTCIGGQADALGSARTTVAVLPQNPDVVAVALQARDCYTEGQRSQHGLATPDHYQSRRASAQEDRLPTLVDVQRAGWFSWCALGRRFFEMQKMAGNTDSLDQRAMVARWADQWAEVAPLLEAERQSRLRGIDTTTAVQQLADAQRLALRDAVMTPWSGLVDMQALLHARFAK